jgi:hypothetical protein
MPSSGTASPISREQANDLLHKLITESIKVRAAFVGRGKVTATLEGTVKTAPGAVIAVSEGNSPTDPIFCFGLEDVRSFMYGDNRAFSGTFAIPGTPKLTSALIFVYPDDTQVILFEIAV